MAKRSEKLYERFLIAANSYLRENKLEDAERNFANALRQVYDREGKLYEIAKALKGLGIVYKKRGRGTCNGEEIVKATGLLMSSLARLKEYNNDEQNSEKCNSVTTEINQLQEEIKNLHEMFIKEILHDLRQERETKDYERIHNYNEMLQRTRETCRVNVDDLDKLPNLDLEKRNIDVERERADVIHQIYDEITKSMTELVTRMIDDCVEVMGDPLCKYAVLGLGSTAREEATPYSDLEFCIVVENDTKDVIDYFTNLTHFLHLKVVELGETILPSLGIQSLNNYYSEDSEGDWFFDKGCKGFSFDGAMPWASKVPTGRGKTTAKPWVQSLIRTPQDMASLLSETSMSKEGYRLADVLSTSVLICGDQSLFEDYVFCTKKAKHSASLSDDDVSNISGIYCDDSHSETSPWKQRILQELIEVERHYHSFLANYIRQPGGSYAVKKDFYRFPSLVLEYLGKYYDTESPSSWETIDKLESDKHLSSQAAHNLRTALGIALELRLRAYLDNKGQHEYFSDLLKLVANQDVPEHFPTLLLRYFFTVIPLEECIRKTREVGSLSHLKEMVLFDDNPLCKSQMYCQFRHFYTAKEILQKLYAEKFQSSSNQDQSLAVVCKVLGNVEFFLENGAGSIKYHRMALDINENIYKANPVLSNLKALGDSFCNYGSSIIAVGQKKEALSYLQKSLEIRKSLFAQSSTMLEKSAALQDVTDAILNLSRCFTSTTADDVSNFFHLNEQALKLCEVLRQEYNLAYYAHHSLYFHQGIMYYDLQMFKESSEAYQKALELFYRYRKYDQHTESEAGLFNNLANAVIELGDLGKAESLHRRAYEIRRRVHGDKDHNSLARSLNNFGLIHDRAGNFKEAQDFFTQARDMSERIYAGANISYAEHLQMYRRNVARVTEKLRTTSLQPNKEN